MSEPAAYTLLADLPLLRPGVRCRYIGSIDKKGGNADWDWWLYQDQRGEWVIFDADGPGCLLNFVQHRYPTSPVPMLRFYFDGESEPRLVVTLEDFGRIAALPEPLAGAFLGDDTPPRGRGPIRVVRSFVPMPFARSCRITSSVRLEGGRKDYGEGGWGHVIWHELTGAADVTSFSGREVDAGLLDGWRSAGQLPPLEERPLRLVPGARAMILDQTGPGAVRALILRPQTITPALRSNLWITLHFDDRARPDVEAPLGAFFGNEYGQRKLTLLAYGEAPDGRLYCFFPMPFWESARIELHNRGDSAVDLAYTVEVDRAARYERGRCGYFRAAPYYPDTPANPGRDSILGAAGGRGHIVAVTYSGRSIGGKWVSCEGDVRLYLDGNTTPQIQSDGSESHACYGWGFVAPGQCNPASGYDGSGEPVCEFSATRSHHADCIPFLDGFRFGLEAGERNDYPMRHSGLVLYYGLDEPGMERTDTLDIGDTGSERAHEYRADGVVWEGSLRSAYEGDQDRVLIEDYGRALAGSSEFTVNIDPANAGVRLRRRCDQAEGRQRARVVVDGQLVAERDWYEPDRNPYYRWLDSDFDIPPRYTAGKSRLRIEIQRVQRRDTDEPSPSWSEFRYDVFSMKGER